MGTKYGFARFLSDAQSVIDDEEANLIVIATRHGSHAALAQLALERGKHVFVEKPLALNDAELDAVIEAASESEGELLVGFNRRFSPLAVRAKEVFAGRQSPLSIVYRVNAGRIPRDHWTQDPSEGGGRLVGEVCHFIDLMQFLTDAEPLSVFAQATGSGGRNDVISEDSVFVTLQFSDGSNGVIAYLAEGDRESAERTHRNLWRRKNFRHRRLSQRPPLRRRARKEGNAATAGQRTSGRNARHLCDGC